MTQTSEMTCRELVEVITDYLEGRMDPADRVRFEHHLVMCDECVVYLQQMRQTVRLVGALTEHSIEEAAKQQLLQAFRTWKHDRFNGDGG
jgi:anti-sigma factor RsiW